jgi:2-methylisocitrate lyase-like PEP mutase family enzyme
VSVLSPSTTADREQQKNKANLFRKLHHGPRVLLLPNAWDAASARIFEDAGFPAIATTSAGIAFTLGYPDGQKVSSQEMLSVIARIAASVKVPVTADVEAGYGEAPADAARTARAVIEAGAVGVNLEDGTDDPAHPLVDLELQLEKLAAVREEAEDSDVPIVINARTDTYLLQVGPAEERYALAMRRAVAFREAGADCIFVPGMREPETIRRFVAELKFPVNILAGPGFVPVPELEKLGVARVSLGSGLMRSTLALVKRMAAELRSSGTYASLEGGIPYANVNRMLEQGPNR